MQPDGRGLHSVPGTQGPSHIEGVPRPPLPAHGLLRQARQERLCMRARSQAQRRPATAASGDAPHGHHDLRCLHVRILLLLLLLMAALV